MGQFKIADFYLDLEAIEALKNESQKAIIHQYYSELLHCQVGTNSTISIFNTLIRSGFLKSVAQEERDEKITQVLS